MADAPAPSAACPSCGQPLPEGKTVCPCLSGPSHGIAAEFWLFLRENKAYWLAPILIVFLLLALLVVAGSTSAAPFIYTLF